MNIGNGPPGDSDIRVELEPHEYGWVVTCRDESGRLLYFANAGRSQVQAHRAARNIARIYNAKWEGRIRQGPSRHPPPGPHGEGGVSLR